MEASELFMRCLEAEGVRYIFGVPGEENADLDDAIACSNALPWAFQAAVVTRDVDRALRAARRLDATAVMVNDHTAFRVDWMPFGGRGPSGLGLGGIPCSVEEMTRPKLIVLASAE